MTITLQRLIETRDGTFGRLTIHEGVSWYTVERRADGEHPRIPAGSYPIHLDTYFHGDAPDIAAYEIEVPGRARILIHPANKAEQLLGCIAPGHSLCFLDGKLAVCDSRAALAEFMLDMKGIKKDWIVIYDPPQ